MSKMTPLHQDIQDIYSRRLQESTDCCGRSDGCGVLSRTIDYPIEEVQTLPAEASRHSFGCGNPLAFDQVQPGDTVLDIGSGAGMDVLLAARRVGPTGWVVGVDMTPAMLERAREAARLEGAGNVEFREGQAEALPVEDSSVDWVISNCVLNLSPDKPAVFREIARVLKPGGRISISDIVLQRPLPEILVGNSEFWAACVGGAIAENDYIAGLEAAGLEQVRIAERLVYGPAVVAEMLKTAARESLPAELVPRLDQTLASVRVEGRLP